MVVKLVGCIMEIKVTPIKKNQGIGKATQFDASVVIGGSKPDIIEEIPDNISEGTVKKLKKVEKSLKKVKKPEIKLKQTPEKTKWQPSGNQVVTKKKPNARERVTFTPNKHIKQLIKEIEAKYGSSGKSEFINVAIEAEFNRRK